jgi:hypothetical protein
VDLDVVIGAQMSYIVIVTPLEGAGDFEVIGAFADKDDAVAWTQSAFFKPQYNDCLFRVKEMRERDSDPRGWETNFPVELA